MSKRVAIIVLNYNSYNYTIACIESLLKQRYQNYTIFLIDNNSTNESVSEITNFLKDINVPVKEFRNKNKIKCEKEDLSSKIIFIQSEVNGGYAAGNNIALNMAYESNEFEYFWVLNNDTIVLEETLESMVNRINNDPFRRPTGTRIYYYENKNKLQMLGGLNINSKIFKPYYCYSLDEIKYLSGASYMIDKKFIEKYGLMTEDYFLNSEDLDYFYQYYLDFKKQFPNENPFNVAGVIYHKESATQGKKSTLTSYYYHRNLLYSNKKFNECPTYLLILIFITRSIKWAFYNFNMTLSILKAIIDYKNGVKGYRNYKFMKIKK